MRNGVYRAWINGPGGSASGVVVLKDGDVFAADPRFVFNGRYREQGGRVTATIACKRLNSDLKPVHLPDLDGFSLRLEGAGGREFVEANGVIDEAPDFPLAFACAFLCEA